MPPRKKPPGKKSSRTEEQKAADKAVDEAVKIIEAQFGKGAIMSLGDGATIFPKVGVISTGSISIDKALGIRGLPRGRIVEVFGSEGTGKTTLALHIIASAQKMGIDNIAFIDAEHALDTKYATTLGVNLQKLLLSQPDHGEQALEIVDQLAQCGGISVIVVDSVAALTPKAELEGEMGDVHMGLQARLMSQAMRKLTGTVHKTKTLLVFINQTREKIGVMFGSKYTTSGGNALKFYASVRLQISRIGAVRKGSGDNAEIIGNRTRVKVVKNKLSPPFKECEFDIIYGEGISEEGGIIELGVEAKIVRKDGAWYSYGDERLGQGKEKARQFLKDHPKVKEAIRKQLEEL